MPYWSDEDREKHRKRELTGTDEADRDQPDADEADHDQPDVDGVSAIDADSTNLVPPRSLHGDGAAWMAQDSHGARESTSGTFRHLLEFQDRSIVRGHPSDDAADNDQDLTVNQIVSESSKRMRIGVRNSWAALVTYSTSLKSKCLAALCLVVGSRLQIVRQSDGTILLESSIDALQLLPISSACEDTLAIIPLSKSASEVGQTSLNEDAVYIRLSDTRARERMVRRCSDFSRLPQQL